MKCLLCDFAAVAECLCVPCGANLWAAQVTDLMEVASALSAPEQQERARALREMRVPTNRAAFIAALDDARAMKRAREMIIAKADAR